MRTVKASEVVKGMRVRVEQVFGTETTRTVEGPVSRSDEAVGTDLLVFHVGSLTLSMDKDHPVTVLAEPEPEWVEGAWYWCAIAPGMKGPMRRVGSAWSPIDEGDGSWPDGAVTVLGRVLIVDWPGDDVARDVVHNSVWTNTVARTTRVTYDLIRDAIRTQGGAP